MQPFLWIALLATLALLVALPTVVYRRRRRRPTLPEPLPTHWALSPRPVFNTNERRIYRMLREALPQHIILSKLPLVRFCQPTDPNELRYWYKLLGTSHVAFAVCSASGRVLAAVDIDSSRGSAQRTAQIKQSVLRACRIRHMRCPPNRLPTTAELQALVPATDAVPNAQPSQEPAQTLHRARDTLANTVAHRRAERAAVWPDSALPQDSFFGSDSRMFGTGSEFGSSDDVGGVVVDAPSSRFAPTRP